MYLCGVKVIDQEKGTNAWWLGSLQSNTDVNNVLADLALVSRSLVLAPLIRFNSN